MAEWTRSTPWRQGSVLDPQLLHGVRRDEAAHIRMDQIGVVVSHDCDLAASPTIEPFVEIVPGRLLIKLDGNFTHAKDARRLHLCVKRRDSEEQSYLELVAKDKVQIRKDELADMTPSTEFILERRELDILRRWLAARYRRHAFSDAFERRFDKVEEKLREILKKSNEHLRAILFDFEEVTDESSNNPDVPYVLDIYLIYTSEPNAEESQSIAQATKGKIQKAFEARYKSGHQWNGIELRSCELLSDQALTYAQYLTLAEWRSEGLSLKSDPFAPMSK